MKIKLLLLLLFLSCKVVFAQTPEYPIRGTPDCGSWVKPESNLSDLRQKAWLIGYLSGINIGFRIEKQRTFNYFSGVTNDQIFLWMDKYCKENPLSNLVSGSADLYIEMTKSK